ncbi:MAG: NAD(P)/FAD-dependent oxidoreductase [Myxococcales bacterium]|nr:NAD(P)/FAD-dependent oxidoreductase [Myxococcales bacterium]
MKSYDAIIIGGGHNGLACAAYLARAGRSVLVLERRHVLGGAAVTEEVYPGFKFSVCSYVVSLLRPQIIRELELARHGLEILPLECSFAPTVDGPGLVRWPDAQRTRDEIARYSAKDASLYPEFGRAMAQLARHVKPIIDQPAPDPASLHPGELLRLARLGKPFRELGARGVHHLVKMMTMSAADFLDEWFESDVLKAPMAVSGIIGTYLGVRSPGTAYVMLHHYMGEIDGAMRAWGFARGGTGEVSMSIARAAQSFGAELRTNAAVSKLLMRGDVAAGVVLADGTELYARAVVSSLDPKLTFSRLVEEKFLPPEFVAQLSRYRMRGSSGKVNLALDALPEFTSRPGDGLHIRGDIAVAPSLDYLERAYDDAKYGQFSRRPYINVVLPTLTDSTLAPPGKHIMSCFVQYAPYHLATGPESWPEHREAFGDAVIDTLEELAPGLKSRILHRQVLTPWDMEKEFGLTEGNIFHGELSLEQLAFLRPAAGFAHYKTPVRGLWMCGSGTHPGGGVMAAPGKLAADRMLKERAV